MKKKIEINILIFFIFFTIIFIFLHSSFYNKIILGNMISYNLFAEQLSKFKELSISFLGDNTIYFANSHTPLYLFLLSWSYDLFGSTVKAGKLLNLIILLTVFLFLTYQAIKKKNLNYLLAFFLSFSFPLLVQSVHLPDADSNLNVLFNLILFIVLKNHENHFSKYFFLKLAILIIVIFLTKETTILIISLSLFISFAICSRSKIHILFLTLCVSWITSILIYILICYFYSLNPANLINSFLVHSDGKFSIITSINNIFIAIKGSLLWIGSPFLSIATYIFFKKIIKFRPLKLYEYYAIISFFLSFLFLLKAGLFVPRYLVAFMFPACFLILEYFNIEFRKLNINDILFSIAFCFLTYFLIGDPIVYSMGMFENKLKLVKVILYFISPLAFIYIFNSFFKKININFFIYTFIILNSVSISFIHYLKDYNLFLNGHGQKGLSEIIEYLKNNDRESIVISSHIDISFYIDNPIMHVLSPGYDIPQVSYSKLPKIANLPNILENTDEVFYFVNWKNRYQDYGEIFSNYILEKGVLIFDNKHYSLYKIVKNNNSVFNDLGT